MAFHELLKKAEIPKGSLEKKHLWKGHVVRAVDGTGLVLPRSEAILEQFPIRAKTKSPVNPPLHYPRALLVSACNVFTGQPTAARIRPFRSSERDALYDMIKQDFVAGDVTLLDRGFDGIKVWNSCDVAGQFYVSRLREIAEGGPKGFQYVREFIESGKREQIVERATKDPETGKQISIRIRLIRGRKLKDRTVLVVGTNLFDRSKYPASSVLSLYAERWKIETSFKHVKTLLQVEKFHARTPNGIHQEIFANLLIVSLTAALTLHATKVEIKKESINPNFKGATEVMRRNLNYWLGTKQGQRPKTKSIDQIIEEVMKALVRRQPGRSYPRVSHQPANRWSHARAYKIDHFKKGIRGNVSQEAAKKRNKLFETQS